MRTLVINSYAGSLTLGASKLGCEIIGSYEDKNFFLDVQRRNFPGLDFRPKRCDWPRQDLSNTIVIAHPPCSAFSTQNTVKGTRGPDSNAFACTRQVLDYALEQNALAVAVESVVGALNGAWTVHQDYADSFNYNLYRVLENGCMFGCQWRERFWSVWMRKDVAPPIWNIQLTPVFKTVGEVVQGHEDGPSPGNIDRLLVSQKERLLKDAECTPEEMAYLFEPQEPPHKTIALGTLLWQHKFKDVCDRVEVFEDFIGGFASGTMVHLGPNDLAPVLMGGSHWYYNGRNLSENGYKRVMGFPAEYEFPETPRNYRKDMRTGLSKGVMPPIAEWILEEIGAHLGLKMREPRLPYGVKGAELGLTYQVTCEPNKIADFRIKKADWYLRHERPPQLRQQLDSQQELPL